MDIKYTDQQIAELINERKVLPDDWRIQLNKDSSLYIIGGNSNRFRLITNQNEKYPSDFSVILAVINPKTGATFRIRRYNGMPKRPHNNKIERQKNLRLPYSLCLQSDTKKEVMMRILTQKRRTVIIILKARLQCLIQDANFELPAQLELKFS